MAKNTLPGRRDPATISRSACTSSESAGWVKVSPPYNVAYLVKILCREIGVERRITPRSLRHSAITIALDAGLELRDVQDFARREDPKTTRGYDRARNQLNRHATTRSPSTS
ncbi:MAG: hypothetical protein M3276_03310, partial [Actinomycetota bacterium]|nr:hypothetical protein [Actinomycetota bacterium]